MNQAIYISTQYRVFLLATALSFTICSSLSGKSFDKEFFQKRFAEYQIQLVPKEENMIADVARLRKEKGPSKINRTIKAFAKNSQYRLLVVGAGWEHSYLKRYRMHYPWAIKILKSYRYTIDLDATMEPDLVGNIMSKEDMSSLQDNFFDSVIFEFIYCPDYID